MPLESEGSHRVAAALVHSAGNGAATAQIAETIVAMWRQIDAALGPIVGRHGVAALYKRSLHLAAAAHPWLAGAHGGVEPALDLAALESLLLQSFCTLLASLVGSSFTERLLRPVWDAFPIDPPAQDLAP